MVGGMGAFLESMRNAAMEAEKDNKKQIGILPAAQYYELQFRWQSIYPDAIITPGKLFPGIVVKPKHGFSLLKSNPLLIVWRLLDENNKQDWMIIEEHYTRMNVIERVDCVVGYLTESDHDAVMSVPYSLCLLEPVIMEDLL